MSDNGFTVVKKVSTSGLPIFDENGMMLKLNYLGDTLSLIIEEPVIGADGKRTYPEEKRYPFLITADRASTLYNEIILKDLLSRDDFLNEDFSKGIFLNKSKTSVLQIRVQSGEIYLVYCKNIDEKRVAEESHVFHFTKVDIIDNYNENTGEFASQTAKEGSFYLFCKYLDAGINGFSNGMAHSIRKVNNASTSAIFEYLKGIAAKLGVTPDSYGPTKPNGSYPSSGFMNPSNEELPFNMEENTNTSMEDIIG